MLAAAGLDSHASSASASSARPSKVRITDAASAVTRRRRATLGTASDRAALYLQRFYFLAQRVERNALFARRVVDAGGDDEDDEGDGEEEDDASPSGRHNKNAADASSAAAAAAVNSRRRRLAARRGAAALTDVRSLLAHPGATAFVLGCISQLEDGRFFLEDPTGRVPLDLRGATATAGFFAENCVVLAEGELHPASRVFVARALGMPPVEPREETLATVAAGPDWFGGRVPGGSGGSALGGDRATRQARALAAQAADGARRCYFLADVGLTSPGGVDRLVSVLQAYEALVAAPGGPPPPAFVLMGDFFGQGGFGGGGSASGGRGKSDGSAAASAASSSTNGCEGGGPSAARAAFASLGVAIATTCRTLAAGSDFIFIPGPGDTAATGGGAGWRGSGGGGSVSFSSPTVLLPAPPLPATLVAPLRATLGGRAHFPSNPARLRIHAREVVVFRSDVAARLRAAALLPPNSGNGNGGTNDATTGASATFEHAALTLLQQAHVCPLPLDAAPVSWDADGGLRLYPLPHALVLASGGRGGGKGAARGCDAWFEEVECFDPGSFSKCGSFRGYAPADGSVESCCAMPEGEDW